MKRAVGPKAFLETFSAVTRRLRAMLVEMYGEEGVGSTQARFVRHVARHGRISQAALARATRTDPALTGRAITALVERGVLRRERSHVDRREYILELGPAGPEILTRINRARERMAERLVRPLDARDVEDFDRIAKKLLTALGDELPDDTQTK